MGYAWTILLEGAAFEINSEPKWVKTGAKKNDWLHSIPIIKLHKLLMNSNFIITAEANHQISEIQFDSEEEDFI